MGTAMVLVMVTPMATRVMTLRTAARLTAITLARITATNTVNTVNMAVRGSRFSH
jgi:hypothetical protein